jgi:hypothetical protein
MRFGKGKFSGQIAELMVPASAASIGVLTLSTGIILLHCTGDYRKNATDTAVVAGMDSHWMLTTYFIRQGANYTTSLTGRNHGPGRQCSLGKARPTINGQLSSRRSRFADVRDSGGMTTTSGVADRDASNAT